MAITLLRIAPIGHKHLKECNNYEQMFWYEFIPVWREIVLKNPTHIVLIIFFAPFNVFLFLYYINGSKINVLPRNSGIAF